MSDSCYASLILIDPSNDVSVGDVAAALRRIYSEARERRESALQESSEAITLSLDGYRFYIHKSSAPHVLTESQEIAESFARTRPDRERIASCRSRFETWADPDPLMEYFNDYLWIGETIARLGRVYLFDPSGMRFMDEP